MIKTKKPPPQYKCPACEEFFIAKDRVKGACPYCLVDLRSVRESRKNGKGFSYEFVIADPQQPELISLQKSQAKLPPKAKEEGRMVTLPGENPEIYCLDEGESMEDGRIENRKFKIKYTNRIHQGWIYCPGCIQKLFQNTAFRTGEFGHEHKCRNRKCKAIVTVVFEQTGRAMAI